MTYRQGLWLIAGIWIMFGLVNIPVLQDLIDYGFDDGTYSHAFLIPFVCLFLIWDTAAKRQYSFRANFGYLAAAVIAALLLAAAYVAQIAPLFRLLLPLALTLFLLSVYRLSITSVIAPLMIIFMIPVWGILAAPLQTLSVAAVTALMSVTPIPTFVQGNLITIPAGTFEIAGGCSGLRYFIVSLAIGVLYCHLNLRERRSCAVFIGLAIFGSLLVNWIRIVGLIIVGHVTSMQSALVEDHNQFGWFIFVPFLVLLFIAGRYLQAREILREQSSAIRQNTVTESPGISMAFRICVLAGITLTSSVLFGRLSSPTDDYAVKPDILDWAHPVPVIPNPSRTTVLPPQPDNGNVAGLEFRFSGQRHDNKATFFRNQFAPDGWRIAQRLTSDSHQFLLVESANGEWGLVRYGFGEANQSIASRSRYRLQRLLNAFQFDAESVLNWTFVRCDNQDACVDLQEKL